MESNTNATSPYSSKYANLNKSYRADRLLRISEKSPEFHSLYNKQSQSFKPNTTTTTTTTTSPFSSSLTRTRSLNPSMFASTNVN